MPHPGYPARGLVVRIRKSLLEPIVDYVTCQNFQFLPEISYSRKNWSRLVGGVRSPSRTLLRLKFPANRENNREFSHFQASSTRLIPPEPASTAVLQPSNLFFSANRNRELTGAYQGNNREFNCQCFPATNKSQLLNISGTKKPASRYIYLTWLTI